MAIIFSFLVIFPLLLFSILPTSILASSSSKESHHSTISSKSKSKKSRTNSAESHHLSQIYNEMKLWKQYEELVQDKYHKKVPKKCLRNEVITFILLGDRSQSSIMKTMDSIFQLSNCLWKVVILYSVPTISELIPEFHSSPPFHLSNIILDSRISYLSTMDYLHSIEDVIFTNITSPWISFINIGDQLTPNYITQLEIELKLFPTTSIVIFQNSATSATPPATALQNRTIFSGYGYALKPSIFKYRSNRSYEHLFEFVSSSILCAGDAVYSYAVTYLSSHAPYTRSSTIPSILVSYKNTTSCFRVESVTREEVISPNSKNRNEQQVSDSNFFSRFVFPELKNPFFADNIRGLKDALLRADKYGCIDPKFRAEFHFGFQTKVKSNNIPLIQIQVEQIHNRTLPSSKYHYNSIVFSRKYVAKLQSASQIWAIAPSHSHFLTQHLNLTNVYLVPLWSMLTPSIGTNHSQTTTSASACRSIVARSFIFETSRNVVSPNNCTIHSSCSSFPTVGIRGTSVCTLPKVLFFGAIRKSDSDRRLHLCELLTREVSQFGCFEGVFSTSLDRLIDSASIIVLERFYEASSLESHRIDPLLLQGKIIVSTKSFDVALDHEYRDVVIFVEDIHEMPGVIHNLLQNEDKLNQMAKNNQKFILNKMHSMAPMCNAFKNLLSLAQYLYNTMYNNRYD